MKADISVSVTVVGHESQGCSCCSRVQEVSSTSCITLLRMLALNVYQGTLLGRRECRLLQGLNRMMLIFSLKNSILKLVHMLGEKTRGKEIVVVCPNLCVLSVTTL